MSGIVISAEWPESILWLTLLAPLSLSSSNTKTSTSSGVEYGSLSVELRRSYSIAKCINDLTSAPPLYDSCKEILNTMQWSTNLVKFGYPWQVRAIEVTLFVLVAQWES